jgi:Ca2+-binding RTX toxin-like protein
MKTQITNTQQAVEKDSNKEESHINALPFDMATLQTAHSSKTLLDPLTKELEDIIQSNGNIESVLEKTSGKFNDEDSDKDIEQRQENTIITWTRGNAHTLPTIDKLNDTTEKNTSTTENISVLKKEDSLFIDTIANPDTFIVDEDETLRNIEALNNDSSSDTFSIHSHETNSLHGGFISLESNLTFTYTPPPNFNGSDFFNYTITDISGQTVTATVTIFVTPVDDGLSIANDDTFLTQEDTSISAFNVIQNDYLIDEARIISYDKESSHGGAISQADSGLFTYIPAPNYYGTDTFTYTITDSDGDIDSATVSITVTAINDGAPTAHNDSASTDEDITTVIHILNNDILLDGALIDRTDTLSEHGGNITLNNDNSVTYHPAENYNGTDTFTYTIKDNDGQTSTATVTININAINDAPINHTVASVVVEKNETLSFNEDNEYLLSVTDIDNNITSTLLSVEHGILTISNNEATIDNNGSSTILISGTQAAINEALSTLQYQPNNNYGGFDRLTMTSRDSEGETDSHIIDIKVKVEADNAIFNSDPTTPASTGLVAHQYAAGSVYSQEYEALDNASIIKEDINDSDQSPSSLSRSAHGVGALAQVNTIDTTNAISLGTQHGNVYTLKGLIYLEADSVYRFAGNRDDALYIELGGQPMVNTFGNSSGNFSTFVDDTTKNTDNTLGITEHSFTPTTSGYYTVEVYTANLVGIGGLALNLSVNNTDYVISADNFSLHANPEEIIDAGGVIHTFSANDNEGENPQGGYFAHNNDADAVGIEGQAITLHNFSVKAEDNDTLLHLMIHVPVNATLYDMNGNMFVSQSGNNSIDVISNQWSLNSLHIQLPDATAGDVVDLDITAITQSISLDTTETQSTFSISILPSDYSGTLDSAIANAALAGDDLLLTGTGFNDTLIAEPTGDTIIIGRDGDDLITGNEGNNTLYGGNGNDHIIAGAGEDLIFSGKGSDTLTGGNDTDTDRFIWLEDDADGSTDTITDFIYGIHGDVIDLHYLLEGETIDTIEDFIELSDNTLHIDRNGDGSGFTDLSIAIGDIGETSLDNLLTHNIVIDSGRTVLRGNSDGDKIFGRSFNGVTTNEDFYGNGGGDSFWGNGGADRYIIEADDHLEYVFDPATLNTQSTIRVQDFFTFGRYDGISEVDAIDLHDVLIGESYDTLDNYLTIDTDFSFGGVYFNVDIDGDGSGTDFYIHVKQDNLDIEDALGYTDDTQQLDILQLLVDNGNIITD